MLSEAASGVNKPGYVFRTPPCRRLPRHGGSARAAGPAFIWVIAIIMENML